MRQRLGLRLDLLLVRAQSEPDRGVRQADLVKVRVRVRVRVRVKVRVRVGVRVRVRVR